MIRESKKSLLLLSVAALMAFAVQGVATASVVGQVITDQAVIDGVAVPSGSTLFTESMVTTRDEPVAVRLTDGRIVGLANDSTARFEERAGGGVAVEVVSGEVGFQESDGEIVLLAQGNSAVLNQLADQTEEGEIGSGIGTGEPLGHVWDGEPHDEDENVKLCHLKDSKQTDENIVLCATDPDELETDKERDEWKDVCEFERIKVEWKDVPFHLGHADVFVDKDMRTSEMPDDEIECGKEGAYWWLASLLLIPAFEDDEPNRPVVALSPVVP